MSDKITFFRGGENGMPRDSTIPRFHIEPVIDELATQQAGRPIYKDEERVQFVMPGNPTQPVERVTDHHRQRWPEQYKAFKESQEWAIEGTPLEQWPVLRRAQVLELKALGLHSVEQVAAMADNAVQKIGMGGQRLRELAAAYLDDAEAGALAERLSKQKETLEATVAAQNRQIDELKALVEQIHTQQMATLNAAPPGQSFVQAHHDPMEAMRQAAAQVPPATSALDNLGTTRKRGRPTNAEIAARQGAAA